MTTAAINEPHCCYLVECVVTGDVRGMFDTHETALRVARERAARTSTAYRIVRGDWDERDESTYTEMETVGQ